MTYRIIDSITGFPPREQLIASAVAPVGGATGFTFSGLDGDAQRVYRIVGTITTTIASTTIQVEPNGITANQYCRFVRARDSGITTGFESQLRVIDGGATTDQVMGFDVIFFAQSGRRRVFMSRGFDFDPATPTGDTEFWHGVWDDTSTVVNEIQTNANQTLSMKEGSRVDLYVLT